MYLIRAYLEERSAENFMKSAFNDAYAILFSDFLYKSTCCGYLFDLSWQFKPVPTISCKVDKSTLAVI